MTQRITVVGNIGQAPVRKATPKGEVTEFTVAHTERVRSEDGVWGDTPTVWYRVSVWGRLGANAAQSLQKGQRVVVWGDGGRHDYTDRDGAPRSEMRLIASAVGPDLTWGTTVFTDGSAARRTPAAQPEVAQPAATPPAQASVPAAPTAGDWGELVPAGSTAWAVEAGIADEDTPF